MADNFSAAGAATALSGASADMAYVQLHTGAPGASGTANVSSTTSRQAVTWNAAVNGTMSASNMPQWGSWAGTNNETVTDISFWSAAGGGTFGASMPLSASITMLTGDTLTLSSLSVTLPVAS